MNAHLPPVTPRRITSVRLVSVLFLIMASMTTDSSARTDTRSHLWKNRLLLIEAPSVTDPEFQRQSAFLMTEFAGLLERDLIVQTSFNVDTFSLKLIGKDGTEKLASHTPVEVGRIFSLIDSMPMRQAEIRRSAVPE
ncbi:MAG: DUF4174 domain-containing protein [Opitutaceae bacterium]